MHRTSAWPLSQAYVGLIVYASLYPFSGWRDQGIEPWAFLLSPLPKYWTWFDIAANAVGYAPLGFLLALSFLRRSGAAFGPRTNTLAVVVATLTGAMLAFVMEMLQTYLPERVPSNMDLGLNTLGACAGASAATGLQRMGVIDRWSRFRLRWFIEDSRGALVLLALWPCALLFPAAVPFGLGQVMERMESALAEWLLDTPFLEWIPLREVELQPLLPTTELLSVALGVLIPCLLGYSVMTDSRRRGIFALGTIWLGVLVTALSAALSWGPVHAWAWVSENVWLGLGSGLVLALVLLPLPVRWCVALLMVALLVHLSIVNQASASVYFSHTLQTWEQGRFIRFNGLAQWLGWLWPYIVLVYGLLRLLRTSSPPRIEA